MILTIKTLGAKPQDYALLHDEQGKWYATCKPEHAEAVKAAIEATIANGNDQRESAANVGDVAGINAALEQPDSHQHLSD